MVGDTGGVTEPNRDPLPMTTPEESSIGGTPLTRWRTPAGRWLVRQVVALARTASAQGVLVVSAAVGLALVAAFTALAGAIYDAVAEGDGVSSLDRPALQQALSLRSDAVDTGLTWFTHL